MSTYETKLAMKTKHYTATTSIIFLYKVLPNEPTCSFKLT